MRIQTSKFSTLKCATRYCSTLVALLAISSLLNIANAYKFISSAAVAGGGKLVANGVDIGWLHFTNGVPLAASFGGQNRIRYLSVDTNNTIDIILVGLESNELIIDEFDTQSKGKVNIVTTLPDKVHIRRGYAQDRITINGQSVFGTQQTIVGQQEIIIGKVYTGVGTYKMESQKLTIKDIVAGTNREDGNFFKIDAGGRKDVDIVITNKEQEKYVIVDDLPYSQWLKSKEVENKNSPTTNSTNSTSQVNQNNSQTIALNTLFAQGKSYNLAKITDTNTMLIYNMLHNYEGTYLAYDYGLANTISVGAFQNGFFARYYTKSKLNDFGQEYGYDVGFKFRSKWTKANLYYSDYFQNSIEFFSKVIA